MRHPHILWCELHPVAYWSRALSQKGRDLGSTPSKVYCSNISGQFQFHVMWLLYIGIEPRWSCLLGNRWCRILLTLDFPT